MNFLLGTKGLNVKKTLSDEQITELKKREKARWKPENLIPCVSEKYPADIAYEYELKYLCWDASNADPNLYKKMYHKWTLSEIYEVILFRRVYNWWS